MFLTIKRLMALSLATSTPEASQRTLLTCSECITYQQDMGQSPYAVIRSLPRHFAVIPNNRIELGYCYRKGSKCMPFTHDF